MTNSRRPVGIDLFAGAGGLSLGFEQAGFDVAASLEIDPIHCATHEYNFPKTEILCADATKIRGKDFLERIGRKRGEVDVVFGGPPCQGFSLIGKRLSDDPRNQLLFHFLRLVDELRPAYFVMENVAGLMIGASKSVLEAFLDSATEIGYDTVRPPRVLNAANYGVPQNRRRVFVLGFRRGNKVPIYPEATTLARSQDGTPLESRDKPGINLPTGPSVGEAIGDLPNIDDFSALLESDSVSHKLPSGSKYARLLRCELKDVSDCSYSRVFDRSVLTGSLRAVHTDESKRRFKATPHGETEPISRFFKLPPEGISNTLRAGTPSNRGAFTSPRPIHPDHSRCISVREAARLHSYPDWFRFHVTKWHGFRQVGNSVPPLLGRAVAASIARAMGAKLRKPDEKLSLGDARLLTLGMSEAAEMYSVSKHVIEPRVRANAP
jgi:DNA (cytosine-5)-methyltransferase 1